MPLETLRPWFSLQRAVELAYQLYGLPGLSPQELPSELGQNFLLNGDDTAYVLKISNRDDSAAVLALQNAALAHLAAGSSAGPPADPDAECYPRLVPTQAGQTMATVEHDGETYFVRLLTYLAGKPLVNVNPHTPALLQDLGAVLGRTDRLLAGFDHPYKSRDWLWDLKHAGRIIRQHIEYITDPARRALVEAILTRFESAVQPMLPALRQSFIHNDGNDHNILVRYTGSEAAVTGLIDFGDMVYSHTVFEVAIAAAYAMLNKPDPLAAAAWVITGYHAEHPLEAQELVVLDTLIRTRLAVSVCLSAYRQTIEPENVYYVVTEAAAWELIHQLAAVHPRMAHYTFRAACGLEPCPESPTVISWLHDQQTAFTPVVDVNLAAESLVLDLSAGSLDIPTPDISRDVGAFTALVFRKLQEAGAAAGIGRYDEARLLYAGPQFLTDGDAGAEPRTVHLGLDIFMPAGTPVHAPLAGIVHSLSNNAAPFDYGPTVILEHHAQDHEGNEVHFYTLYGHLNTESLDALIPGQRIAQGAEFAHIGNSTVNGGWPPHLHLQIIVDLLGAVGDFPGVGRASQRAIWRSLCPDPNLLLGIPPDRFPPAERTTQQILAARHDHLGQALSVSYNTPLKIVRGCGQYLYDENGHTFLDAVNNVPHVGHSNPRVVAAAQKQMAVLNTNTRYLHDNLVRYAERLLATLPDPLEVCFFVCSGSEANELALRLARAHSGNHDVMVLDGAYHGNTNALIDISPYKFNGRGGAGQPEYVHVVPIPDGYRGQYKYADPDAGRKYAAQVRAALERAAGQGRSVAAFFTESLPSCGGLIMLSEGYLPAAYAHVRAAGGVCVADEVQVGFGRLGTHFWGFQSQGVVPDIVTMGKPIGNGHPLAAVVTTREIADSFANGMEYFNTFGGNPVSCAIGLAVLDEIEAHGLQAHALQVGNQLKAGLLALMERFPLIGDVRGSGLFIGAELVRDRGTLEPAGAEASYIANRLRAHGILISTEGPLHNVLKIRPPMVFTAADAARLLEALERILQEDFLQIG